MGIRNSLPDQLWEHDEENPPQPDKIEDVECSMEKGGVMGVKPVGGMWTSTLNDKGTSAWIDWMKAESWTIRSEPLTVWRLKVQDDLKIFEIDSYEDLVELIEKVGHQEEIREHFVGLMEDSGLDDKRTKERYTKPDWEEASKHFDAIHMTGKGQRETRGILRDGYDLYGWDCESTLWFDWCFETVEHYGEIEIGARSEATRLSTADGTIEFEIQEDDSDE